MQFLRCFSRACFIAALSISIFNFSLSFATEETNDCEGLFSSYLDLALSKGLLERDDFFDRECVPNCAANLVLMVQKKMGIEIVSKARLLKRTREISNELGFDSSIGMNPADSLKLVYALFSEFIPKKIEIDGFLLSVINPGHPSLYQQRTQIYSSDLVPGILFVAEPNNNNSVHAVIVIENNGGDSFFIRDINVESMLPPSFSKQEISVTVSASKVSDESVQYRSILLHSPKTSGKTIFYTRKKGELPKYVVLGGIIPDLSSLP